MPEDGYPLMIIPCNQRLISRKEISENALKVLHRLSKAGYDAYLVGGGVRDILLGKKPKDFDITTNATPEQTRKLFSNCRLIGRRFLLAHIIFRAEIIEVATFRGYPKTVDLKKNISKITSVNNHKGILLRDNIFGSIEEDAQRRDFSINSLYYSINDFNLRDYTGGLRDLNERKIRLIGDPETRYREDPVRMLRAIRFAARLNMTISHETAEPIPRLAVLLSNIPLTRLFEEALKLLQTGYSETTYRLLCKYKLFQLLFPSISRNFTENNSSYIEQMVIRVLADTDQRLRDNKQINPAFLFAAMLWYPLSMHTEKLIYKKKLSYFDAFSLAISNILDEQCRTLVIPKRFTILMREIWQLQLRLSFRKGQFQKLIDHPKFYAAYDLLTLRAEIENSSELQKLSYWWKDFQESKLLIQKNMLIKFYSNKSIHNYRHHYCYRCQTSNCNGV